MIKAEFGIIDNITEQYDFSDYEPEKYHCIFISDDLYLNDWWDKLLLLKTYFHNLDRPSYGLARYGVTLIPLESLSSFQDIVISDKRINTDDNLLALAEKIHEAIEHKKFMIHYGV